MSDIQYSLDLYPKVAILKAAYQMIDRCYIHLDEENNAVTFEITPKEGYSKSDIVNDLDNEVLAQTVRYHVYQQTHEIREMLVGRAMASTIINATPTGTVQELDTDLNDIITDWFEKNERNN